MAGAMNGWMSIGLLEDDMRKLKASYTAAALHMLLYACTLKHGLVQAGQIIHMHMAYTTVMCMSQLIYVAIS